MATNKYNPSYFSGQLPVAPVYKKDEATGQVDLHYCHTQRELDDWTKSRQEGGKEYQDSYIHQDWPKIMSHPTQQDLKVFSHLEIESAEARGYSFDHFANLRKKAIAKVKEQISAALVVKNDALAGQLTMELEALVGGGAVPELNAAPGSFTPQMDAVNEQRMQLLEAQNRELMARLDVLSRKRNPARRGAARKAQTAEATA